MTSGGSSDDVTIGFHAVGTDEIPATLDRIRRDAGETGDALEKLGRSGQTGGRVAAEGLDKLDKATGRARDSLGRFLPMNREVGESLGKTGRKAVEASGGMDLYERKIKKATRALGGMAGMMMLIKFGALLYGLDTLVGMIGSLGAGAVMAVGALAPMVGVLGALGPAAFLAAGMMGIFKLTAVDLKALFRPLTYEFMSLRTELTARMMPGIQILVSRLQTGLFPVVSKGMLSMADSIGTASGRLGDMLSESRLVSRVGSIFGGMNPLIQAGTTALGNMVAVFVNLAYAAMPMTNMMAGGLTRVTDKLNAWSQRMVDTGKAQAFFTRAWSTTVAVGKTLYQFLAGLFHLFALGGQVAREGLGGGIEAAAKKFNDWTKSTKGSGEILGYFRASVPILKETGKLLGAIVLAFGHIGVGGNLAGMLAQLRTQLLPALVVLIDKLTSAGGAGPALISLFTTIAQALGKIPLTGLIMVAQGVGAIAAALAWLVNTVPGAGPVIGFFLSLLVAGGIVGKVTGWVLTLGKRLGFLEKPARLALRVLAPLIRTLGLSGLFINPMARILPTLANGLVLVGQGVAAVGEAIATAFLADPIIFALVAIIALLLVLWFKFAWFRDMVMGAMRAIGDFFTAIWSSAIGKVTLIIAAPLVLAPALKGLALTFSSLAGSSRALAPILKPLSAVLGAMSGVLRAVGAALLYVGEALLGLIVANPIIAAIIGIILVLVILWFKFAWFRDAVMAALQDIGDFFVWIWNGAWAATASFLGTILGLWGGFRDFIVNDVFKPIGDFGAWIWGGIVTAATTVANVVMGIWHGVIDVIKAVYNTLAWAWNAIPHVKIPSWIPLIGGQDWGLPKLPLMAKGGVIEYSTAIVGEQGPEALVSGGKFLGMLGMHGPELATGLPVGGYVVPNLDTLASLPGLARGLPGGVADAVSAALPAYGSLLGRDNVGTPDVRVSVDSGSEEIVDAIETLAAVLLSRHDPPPSTPTVSSRRPDPGRDGMLKARYSYASPRRPR